MKKIAVKQLRKNLNLTLKEMAAQLGVNKSTVWRWEKYGVPSRGATAYLLEALWNEQSSPMPSFANGSTICAKPCQQQSMSKQNNSHT
ncbi:helix-turn-helix domain-containing protein [Bartonella sp. A05]|uniref:helix-turn-helix domain-containing protein n=1 Tax=Bartonella sp. A05 TaxID=2967261 RepID=UPI0022A98980|nr:helix-turn-helix transcriptional regulator [Bartonella sp. A05]MCZ2204018.1 helix-turn-helix domain-containing protein [Bartonella sp. A05]